MAATSSYMSYLMVKGTGDTWTKLVDIKSYGNLGGEPENLQTTTLSNEGHTYVPGLKAQEMMSFGCNYDPQDYVRIKAMENQEKDFAVWFGAAAGGQPDGSNGKFSFKGQLAIYVNGAGVNEVREMTVSIAPSTDISFSAS